MSATAAIGGVMPAEPADPPAADSLWDAWSAPFSHHAAFANARSALAALLRDRSCPRVWLPAYACPSLAESALAGDAELRFYPVGIDLDLIDGAWTSGIGPRDAVAAIDFFGRPPGDAWRALRARLDGVLWLEDRAQALDTGATAAGDVILYSPRKLVGVGDGGLVFGDAPLPAPTEPGDDGQWAPEVARAADPDGREPDRWRSLFQAREAGVGVGGAAASPRTLAALRSIPHAPIAARRRANWERLAPALADYALWPILTPTFAPLAFPIVVDDAAAAVHALAGERIWAPRHWADQPSDPGQFPEAHWLAAHCVSLPLDQRYAAADMDRIAAAVRRLATPGRRPSSRSRR